MKETNALIEEFRRRWKALGGLFFRAENIAQLTESIRHAWDELVVADTDGLQTVVYWADAPWDGINWSALIPANVVRWDGSTAMRSVTERAVLGITGCAWAIAATGSVALYSTPETGLLPSVLPPSHLVLVRVDDVVETVADGLRRVPRPAMPPLMKIVTGPSMTADIEGTLVTGVHGPGRVAAIVYGPA